MALAILAQTPQATIGQTLAVDPEAGIPLQKEFCTPAEKTVQGDHTIYGLTDGELPDPATVVLTPATTADGRDHVTALVSKHSDIDVRDGKDDAASTLGATLDELIAAESQTESPLGLPLSILDATPAKDTMAIIYSGDGGWRDIDRELAGFLQKDGIPSSASIRCAISGPPGLRRKRRLISIASSTPTRNAGTCVMSS